MVVHRFKYQQQKDTEINRKLNKLNQDIQRLNQVATHHTGFLDIEIQEAEDSTRDKSQSQFNKKKRSAHSLKPMD